MISDAEEDQNNQSEDWLPICDNKGRMYFYNKNTGETQRTYPKIYNKKQEKYLNIL